MALTPEQILNKHFQTTQFRKGYDERDVDDFLDEIVAEMRTLLAQRDDFKQQLNDCRAGRGLPPVREVEEGDGTAPDEARGRLAELQRSIVASEAREKELGERVARAQSDLTAAEAALQDRKGALDKSVQQRPDAAESRAREAMQAREAAEQRTRDLEEQLRDVQEQAAAGQSTARAAEQQETHTGAMRAVAAGGTTSSTGASAAALIELAQRLHDEHVGKGEATRDELIAEGQREHDELVTTARAQHDELISTAQSRHEQLITEGRERSAGMIAEAQQRRAGLLSNLEQEKARLEGQIEQLRGFERSYRSQLKAYLQNQLEELEQTGTEPATVEVEASAAGDAGEPDGAG